jgi:hypothetical protein
MVGLEEWSSPLSGQLDRGTKPGLQAAPERSSRFVPDLQKEALGPFLKRFDGQSGANQSSHIATPTLTTLTKAARRSGGHGSKRKHRTRARRSGS